MHRDHPILKPTLKVAIGLDKSTKLGTVFERYVAFCNDHRGGGGGTGDNGDTSSSRSRSGGEKLSVEALEFVHCSVLQLSLIHI